MILFAWPYYDARFWRPVLPLLIAYFLLAVQRFNIPRAVVAVYCICYGMPGLGILAFSSRITFSGCQFPETFGSGELTSVYRAAFDSCPNAINPDQVDQRVLRLLREFR